MGCLIWAIVSLWQIGSGSIKDGNGADLSSWN
jgi:hypothetical protein